MKLYSGRAPSEISRNLRPGLAIKINLNFLVWFNVDKVPAASGILEEAHSAIGLCEDGVVATNTHVEARIEMRSALAHDDVARRHSVASKLLHTEELGIRITAVLG